MQRRGDTDRMQRRGFLARLGALITGAAIASHVKAQEPSEVVVPCRTVDTPGLAFVPEYSMTTTNTTGVWYIDGNVTTAYVAFRGNGAAWTDNFCGPHTEPTMTRSKLKKRRDPRKPGPRKPCV